MNLKKRSLKDCGLYVIIDREISGDRDIVEITRDVLRGGADIIQLRDKLSNDRSLIIAAKRIKDLACEYGTIFIINDRSDIALISGADGVHLGQDDMSPVEARKILGDKIIGFSTHSIEQIEAAARKPIDYIGIGPIFKSSTKTALEPIGSSILRNIFDRCNVPYFPIGGINLKNIHELTDIGVRGIAVTSSAIGKSDVCGSVRELKKTLKGD
ncbi:MAG: thiamine phosphate synthase [Candidatus Omnitrophica bacterium]|nr:thiamine phosphate synthase [Candidatus Omnitrophota bacterium]